jgi:hypothetical protein
MWKTVLTTNPVILNHRYSELKDTIVEQRVVLTYLEFKSN